MPTPIPLPVAEDSTGLADATWITDVRGKLRDKPKNALGSWIADGVNGLFGYNSAPVTLNQGPVYDGSPISSYIAVRDTTASQTYTVVTTQPTTNQVQIDYDAATLTFPTAPVSTHVFAMSWFVVKWTDVAILSALYAGLRQMFPSVGKTYVESSTQIAVNQWDYTLPVWCQSPDAQISKVEYRDPDIATEPWRPLDSISDWNRVGTTLLHVNRAGAISPVGKLRITGWGPYISLGDLEPDLYNLPIWYAGSVLLPWQESFRIRQDTMVPLSQEGGQAPGLLTQTGDYYQKRFDAELKQKKRAYGPPGSSRPITTTYALSRHV